MSLLNRITEINNKIPNKTFAKLIINNQHVGHVDSSFISELPEQLFEFNADKNLVCANFEIKNRLQFEQQLNEFFLKYFKDKNLLSNWRNEKYAVRTDFSDETVFLMERAALSYLGITGYGVHINGYLEKDNIIWMWIAKRSKNKPTSPNKLDQIAAGGMPYNISVLENIIKECDEEASIPENIAKQALYGSTFSYWYELEIGVRPDIIFNYDLQVPSDFIPQANDNEVDSFELMPMPTVLDKLANSNEFKYNSAVVIIDFALRHGLLNKQPDYLQLQQAIHNLYPNNVLLPAC